MVAGDPLLIVGAGRGGTSITAALLDAHTEIEIAFEHGAAEFLLDPSRGSVPNRCGGLRAACGAASEESSARVWGNKITTEQISALVGHDGTDGLEDVLKVFFLDAFAGSQVIFVLRSGPACVMSKVRRTGIDLRTAAERWIASVDCYRFLVATHPACLTVRFEELIASPEAVLREMCEFVGASYEPSMLAATNSPKLLPEYRRAGFELSAIAPVEVPPEITARLGPAMRQAGYAMAVGDVHAGSVDPDRGT